MTPENNTNTVSAIRGARTHNLKGISVDIPRDRLTVITGVSGSGKSSLAFDTIYAEGQRRYISGLSAHEQPKTDLHPTLSTTRILSPFLALKDICIEGLILWPL